MRNKEKQRNNYKNQRRAAALMDFGYITCLLLKEVIKVSRIFEAEGIGNVGNTPVGMLKQRFGFADNSFGNMGSSGFTGNFLNGTI